MRIRSLWPAVLLIASSVAAGAADPPVEPLVVSKQTTYVVEPLRSDGTPDYAAWLNRLHGAGVTSENNAARELLAVELPSSSGPQFRAQDARARRGPWHEREAPLVAAWLHANEATLLRVEQVVRDRPRFFVPVATDHGFDTEIPSRRSLRSIANALRARAFGRMAMGDLVGARRDLALGLRFAAVIDQGPWLIDRLLGLAVRGIATEPVVTLANPPPPDHAAAAELLEIARRAPRAPPLDAVLEVSERVLLLAAWADLYRAARGSSDAWNRRVAAIVEVHEQVWRGLGDAPTPIASLKRVPGWAIDWNELFRRANECANNADCEPGLAEANRDLASGQLEDLLDQAPHSSTARQRLARAVLSAGMLPATPRRYVSWNEQQAIHRLAAGTAGAAVAFVDRRRYPASATELATAVGAEWFDAVTGHDGYTFDYSVTEDGRRFSYTARPQRAGETGVRRFCADSAGRLASTLEDQLLVTKEGLCAASLTTLAARVTDTR